MNKSGWYQDAENWDNERFWDGTQWTDSVRVKPSPSDAVEAPRSEVGLPVTDAVAAQPRPIAQRASYVALQVILKEKLWGTGSGNLTELERAINTQAALGYRLHTITTASSGSKGLGGGDRIQATMIFERLT